MSLAVRCYNSDLTQGGKSIMLTLDKKTFATEVLEAEGYVFVDFTGDG